MQKYEFPYFPLINIIILFVSLLLQIFSNNQILLLMHSSFLIFVLIAISTSVVIYSDKEYEFSHRLPSFWIHNDTSVPYSNDTL